MFTVGGLKFWFKHYPNETGFLAIEEDGFDSIPVTPYKGKTVCYVEDIINGELILDGEAYCSPNDIFDKARGRKVSLSRAIEGLSKDERTEIWYVYTKTTGRL
jgi:hypothetical protein